MTENEITILKKKAEEFEELSEIIRNADKIHLTLEDSDRKYPWLVELPMTDEQYKRFAQLLRLKW